MPKTAAMSILCFLLTASIGAADWEGPQRASLSFFPHKLHQKNLGGCSECHDAKGPGPIAQFGENWAHTTCKGCHSKKHTGPVECSGCHTQF